MWKFERKMERPIWGFRGLLSKAKAPGYITNMREEWREHVSCGHVKFEMRWQAKTIGKSGR